MTIRDVVCITCDLWCKSAKDGKKSYMHHYDILTCFSISRVTVKTPSKNRWPELPLFLSYTTPYGSYEGDDNLYDGLTQ